MNDKELRVSLDSTAKILIVFGIILILIGLGWQIGWIQQLRLGRLPGDIYIQKENMTVFIPITTCLLLSLVIAFFNWLFK